MRLAFILLLLSACASDKTETVADACNQVATARCDRLAACSMADLRKRWPDEATCIARETLACTEGQAAPNTAATPVTVSACADALAASTCESMFAAQPPAACAPQDGPGAVGAACSFASQCSTGYCSVGPTTLCGTCETPPVAGADCTTAGCGPTLVCVRATMQCQAPVAAGGACGKGLPCEETLACVGATDTVMGTCTAQLTTVGATCDPTRKTGPDCASSAGVVCDAMTKQCVTQPLAAAGQPCGPINGVNTACLAGATCVIPPGTTSATCIAPAADGAACDETTGPGCETPARCVGGTCQLPGSQTCS